MTNEEMIVKLEEDGLSTLSDMEFITNALQENTKLKAEIEQLKEDSKIIAKELVTQIREIERLKKQN